MYTNNAVRILNTYKEELNMICRLIGIGAAGNKAAIAAVENNVISVEKTMLINSTLKDIPAEYQSKKGANVKQYAGAYGGCGKERNISNKLATSNLASDTLDLNTFLGVGTDAEAELVIIVASTEGGTGSGSAPLIGNFILNVYGIPVHIFGIAGFEDDVRGMRNTVEFFKEMNELFAVECIKNSKFLAECNGNKLKAEKKANEEFCKKISVLMGLQIRDSEHNIDPTDLLKLSAKTSGYMVIETCTFDEKIKNREQFRQAVIDALDTSKSLDISEKGMKALGVIMNVKRDSTDYIDYKDIILDRFGVSYEIYEHIQHEEKTMPEFIAFIMAGLKMPTEEIEATYKRYKDSVAKVSKSGDAFFSTIQDAAIDPTDASFNLDQKKIKTMNKDEFFRKMATGAFANTKTKMVSVPDDENLDNF